MPEIGLGCFFELAQNRRGDFRRRILFTVDIDLHEVVWPADDLVRNQLLFRFDLIVPATHEALDRVDGAPRVSDGLALGGVADQPIALIGEGDNARGEAVAFLIGDDLHLAAFHHSDDGIGRAQIDANDLFSCHDELLLRSGPSGCEFECVQFI